MESTRATQNLQPIISHLLSIWEKLILNLDQALETVVPEPHLKKRETMQT